MYCPVCGQQQISDETRFCSRCGFPLIGVSELISNRGVPAGSSILQSEPSAKKRGVKQGLFIFLLAFLVVPIVVIISIALRAEPFAAVFAAVLLTIGGLLRMAYALLFESGIPGQMTLEEKLLAASQRKTLKAPASAALPPNQTIPASDYVSPTTGAWRDTNELERDRIGSVTEGTTRLLEKESTDQ
jgi:hypothetical protein